MILSFLSWNLVSLLETHQKYTPLVTTTEDLVIPDYLRYLYFRRPQGLRVTVEVLRLLFLFLLLEPSRPERTTV